MYLYIFIGIIPTTTTTTTMTTTTTTTTSISTSKLASFTTLSSKDKITENTKDIITSNDKTNSKKLLDTNNEDFDEETVLTDGEVNGIVISILVVIALIIGLTTFAFLRSYYKQNPN